jgi:hypothetical protein
VSAATSAEFKRKGNDSLKQAPCHGLRHDGWTYSLQISIIPNSKYRQDRVLAPFEMATSARNYKEESGWTHQTRRPSAVKTPLASGAP